ncbi:DUF559 domain-containing protein [Streptosporangium sp. NPDC048047]|uniref:DUF559 domain-containing protein n=1 Tax=Streptosporangium sp. NPDC048047 TaxID=3155748 RepID=UPI003425FAC8
MAQSWTEVPMRHVVRVRRMDSAPVEVAADALPEGLPAVLTCSADQARIPRAADGERITRFPETARFPETVRFPERERPARFPGRERPGRFVDEARTASEIVGAVLDELERAVIALFPAWLPGAEGVGGAGGAAVLAVRELAGRMAAGRRGLAPFLADLAARSLVDGTFRNPPRTPAEVRAAGLALAYAVSFGRTRTAILVRVPEGLPPAGEERLVEAGEWLIRHGGLGFWLTGAGPASPGGVPVVTVEPGPLPSRRTPPARPAPIAPPARPAPGVPPVPSPGPGRSRGSGGTPARPAGSPAGGRPHPGSTVESALERALGSCAWAAGRAWNQTYQPGPLLNPIRVDLLWRAERCVVELDGPEHRGPENRARDRARDARLRGDGYAVLRFDNDRVMNDLPSVLRELRKFLQARRGPSEG